MVLPLKSIPERKQGLLSRLPTVMQHPTIFAAIFGKLIFNCILMPYSIDLLLI